MSIGSSRSIRQLRKPAGSSSLDAYTAFVMYLVGSKAKVPKPSREKWHPRVLQPSLRATTDLDKIRKLFLADRIELAEILAEPHEVL